MRVAVVGKGGAGKTVLAALLSRAFAERGRHVLALDLDSNPGLAISLGIAPADVMLPDEALEECAEAAYGWRLSRKLTPTEAVRRYGTPVTPQITFLGLGNIADAARSVKRSVTAVREVAEGFAEPGWVTIGDLEAGPTTPFEGYPRFADEVLTVVEASPASLLAASRIRRILRHDGLPVRLVVAQAREAGDVERVVAELGPVSCVVPFDPEVRRRELLGPLLDLPATSAAVLAAQALAAQLEAGVVAQMVEVEA